MAQNSASTIAGPRILSWRPWRNEAGTVLGYISAEMPSGMIIHSLKLMVGPKGTLWIATPGTKREVSGGKPVWDPIVDFSNREVRDRFGAAILAALREQHPDAFDNTSSRGRAAA